MDTLRTRASSINRALDQVGDKWCLLVIQEMFWGINTFRDMLQTTGVSRGVLADRLRWLEGIGCLRKDLESHGPRRPIYHLTRKSVDLYACALMAVAWERRYYETPALDSIRLVHRTCGRAFSPQLQCGACHRPVRASEVRYAPGPGATRDLREKKVRRRSSVSAAAVPSARNVYRNLVNLVGDRWTANLIALAFHDLTRFEEFQRELPVASNILSDRLRLLVAEGILETRPYQARPPRYSYHLTDKGLDLFPWFLTLQQWGDRWCDLTGAGKPLEVTHVPCGAPLYGVVVCDQCGEVPEAHAVEFHFGPAGDRAAHERAARDRAAG
jgi:DNA-binding HxlR family transcriptional regulator